MTTPEGVDITPETEFPQREILLDTSLHEITHKYEAEGLRQRFLYEVEGREYDHETTAHLRDAVDIALDVHEGQTRGEWTYATHILRVATRIISPDHFDISDPAIIIAALLHDTIEDRPERLLLGPEAALSKELPIEQRQDLRRAALGVLHQGFGHLGPEVAGLTEAVTNQLYDKSDHGEAEQLEIYQGHVVRQAGTNPKARIIKMSDLIDNYCGIKYNEKPTKGKDRLALKYAPIAIEALNVWLPDSSTPLYPEGRLYIAESLKRGSSRHLADLHARGLNYPALEDAFAM